MIMHTKYCYKAAIVLVKISLVFMLSAYKEENFG